MYLLRRCIWRTSLGAHGMLRKWQTGRRRKDGLYFFKSWNTNSFWPVVLMAFPLAVEWVMLWLLLLHWEAAGGGWQRGVIGCARAGVRQIWILPHHLVGLSFLTRRMGVVYSVVVRILWDHICQVPGAWKAFKKSEWHSPVFLHPVPMEGWGMIPNLIKFGSVP